MELPSLYQSIYYVYLHTDPRSNQVRYIGMGQGQRAWMMRNTGEGKTWKGHRNKKHWEWFLELETLGYTLEDIVTIHVKALPKSEALLIEKKLIEKEGHTNLFNENIHYNNYMKRKDKIEGSKTLRELGYSYKEISKELSFSSAMTAWRYCNE